MHFPAPRSIVFFAGAMVLAQAVGAEDRATAPSSPMADERSSETSGRESIRGRWIPALSIGLVVAEDRVEGAIDSSVEFSDAGSIGTTVARLQLGLDVASPAIRRLPVAPRVVGFAGLQVKGPNERNEPAAAGDFPDLRKLEDHIANAEPSMATGEYPPPESFDNQGSRLTGEYGIWGWVLGLGLVFEFPQRENADPALRIRPFVSYVGETIELRGEVADVIGRPVGDPPVGEYTIRHSAISKDEVLHMLGPGLDAELVLASTETMTLGLFAKLSFLWNVGEESFDFADAGGLARFDVEVDDFRVRSGGGLRLAWRRGI